MNVYWFRRARYPVTVHLAEAVRFEWTSIVGIQVGRWFIGAIQGSYAPAPSPQEGR